MKYDRNYILIPVELCQFVLKNKLTTSLKLLIFLKMRYGGAVKEENIEHSLIRLMLKFKSDKTIKKHFKKLIDLNWIGVNPQSNWVFIRGFESIRKQFHFIKRASVEINLGEINNIKEICFAALATALIAVKKRKNWNLSKRGGAPKRGGALQPLPFAFPIAIRVFSKILNLSVSTIHFLKESCKMKGYIYTKRNLKLLEIPITLRNEWLSIDKNDIKYLKRKKGKVYIEAGELYVSNLKLFKRKKIKQ